MKTHTLVLGAVGLGLAGILGYEAYKTLSPRKQVAAQSYGAFLTSGVIDTSALPAQVQKERLGDLPAHSFLATFDEEPDDVGVAFVGMLGSWLIAQRAAGKKVYQRPEPFEEDALVFALDDAPHDWLEVTF